MDSIGSVNSISVDSFTQLPWIDPFTVLPEEISLHILSMIKPTLSECALTCRKWKRLSDDPSFYPKNIVNAGVWKNYIGDPGKEPNIPRDVHKYLETGHFMLTLVPKTVDGENLNIKKMNTLAKSPKKGQSTSICVEDSVNLSHQEQEPIDSHWVLMTKKVHPFTLNKRYDQALRTLWNRTCLTNCYLLDTIVCVLMRKIVFDEYCYSGLDSWTLTMSENFTSQYTVRYVYLGGFGDRGLILWPQSYVENIEPNIGAAGCLRHFSIL